MIGSSSRALVKLAPRAMVLRQSVARSHNEFHEVVYKGNNLPFDITNPRALAVKMIIFFSIPFALPYLVWRRRLYRKGI